MTHRVIASEASREGAVGRREAALAELAELVGLAELEELPELREAAEQGTPGLGAAKVAPFANRSYVDEILGGGE